jgi:uncharacterized protein (DUF983 family)
MWEMLKAMWIGMRLRCPSCRQGRIYRNWRDMNEECPVCGVVFQPDEGDFVGAMVIAYSITAVLICIGAALLAIFTDLDVATQIIVWAIFSCLFLPLTYRNMKGIWIGIVHAITPLTRKH